MANKPNWEKEYQVQEDARTLARYQEIMEDSKRKAAAVKEAKKLANDLMQRANALKKATGGKLKK